MAEIQDGLLELRITFSVSDDDEEAEWSREDGASPNVDGLTDDALPDIRKVVGATSVRVQRSSLGVGASGPAIDLVLQIAERVMNDTASLIALGAALQAVIGKVRKRKKRFVVVSDGNALGAIAAANVNSLYDRLAGMRFSGCRPLTGWPEYPKETDDRFVWVAVFEDTEASVVLAIFVSPTGTVLGHVLVPAETTFDMRVRPADELRDLFRRLNGLA